MAAPKGDSHFFALKGAGKTAPLICLYCQLVR